MSLRSVSYLFASALLVVCAAFSPSLASAQTGGTGSIQGSVTDPTGAVVTGATVTATNNRTGVVTQVVTTDSGRYVIPLLQPAPYKVTISAGTFAPLTRDNVVVDALAVVSVNAQLSISTASQSVTVTGDQQMLATDDLKLGSTIENETYSALPLAMNQSARDPSAFIGLAVGVNSFSVQAAGPSTASFNGGQTYQNETYIEGLAMTSAGTESDTRNLAFGVSVEAVEQFQVAVTGSEAMYEGQGVSNFIVKSGTNKFHGGVYEYFRNTIFDAKNFFTLNRTVEHQNEFGGSLGGPILKNKLFFFANYDGYRFSATTTPTQQTVPTLKARNGDFSEFPQKIYDPTTCLTTNAAGACTSRQQFAFGGVLNVINPSRLSAVAKSFQSYLPAPTGTGINQNYLAVLPNVVTNDSGTLKVDYDFNAKHRMFGIFTRGKYANPLVGSLGGQTATTNSALPVPYTDGRGVIEYATLAQTSRSVGHSSQPGKRLRLWLEPPVYSAHQQHRRRQLSVQSRTERFAGRHRGDRFSRHHLHWKQPSRQLGRNQLARLQRMADHIYRAGQSPMDQGKTSADLWLPVAGPAGQREHSSHRHPGRLHLRQQRDRELYLRRSRQYDNRPRLRQLSARSRRQQHRHSKRGDRNRRPLQDQRRLCPGQHPGHAPPYGEHGPALGCLDSVHRSAGPHDLLQSQYR